MKKKLIRISTLFLIIIVLALVGLSFFAQSFLKGEKLKSIIIPQAETFTGRKVGIDDIRFSLFRGIVLKGLTVKEEDGTTDFGTVGEFVLDYRLFPLLKKQLVISKIDISAPVIHVKRDGKGRFNFSTIIEKDRQPGKHAGPEGGDQLPFSVTTESVSVRDLSLRFTDDTKELPSMTAQGDIAARVSLGRNMKEVIASGTLILREMKTVLSGVPVSVKGTIWVDPEVIKINLDAVVDKDAAALTGTIQNYRTTPNIMLSLIGKEMDLGKLAMPAEPSTTKGKKPKGRIGSQEEKKEMKVSASGEVKFDAVKYAGYTLKNVILGYRFKDGIVTFDPVRVHFAGGDQMRSEGDLKGRVQLMYVPGTSLPEVKKSITGKGTVMMSMLEIKQSRIFDAVALFVGLPDLRSMRFTASLFSLDIKDQKVLMQGSLDSSSVRLNPAGSIGFDGRLDVATDLKVAPQFATKLPTAKYSLAMKDEQGWTVVPLKISGTVRNPSVAPNVAGLGRQIERGITDAIRQKPSRDSEQPVKGRKQTQDLFKGLFGK